MDYSQLTNPAFVLHEELLHRNLQLIDRVQHEAGVDIILAFKGFAMWSAFPVVRQYLHTATASSLYEARLCFEEMKAPAHTYSPAYRDSEIEEILSYSSHITFNSLSQFERFRGLIAEKFAHVSCGIRVNPEYSPVETELYNPCAPGSRLGIMREELPEVLPEGIEGIHFHALCESSAENLETLLENFEERFGHFLPSVKWVNMGGGHLMTRKAYNVEKLIKVLKAFRGRYPHLRVILEPGSAIAWDTGVLTAHVLDVVQSRGRRTALLDVSFTAHMPDTLEMPYRPRIRGVIDPQTDTVPEGYELYRLGGVSCLAGDYHFEYAFPNALQAGDLIVFEDMIHYTMVKTTMFNGVGHPDIAIARSNGEIEIVRQFEYSDFKNRLS